jgi:glycosyltransferase involved in cell wall biosynthesis
MKVLWVAHAHPPDAGGISTHGKLLVPALAQAGVDMHVVSIRDRAGDEVVDGVPVHRMATSAALTAGDNKRVMADRMAFARLVAELQPDVIHAQLPDPAVALALTLPAVRQIPLVSTLHNDAHMVGREGAMAQVLGASTLITTVAAHLRADLAAAAPRLVTRLTALPNAIEPGPPPAPPVEAPVLLAGGRLADQKGIDVLLVAMPAIRAAVPDVQLVIVGPGQLEGELRAQATSLHLDDVVTFVGGQPPAEVRRLLDGARMLVMPSRYEGMPYFALEAAVAGRPVVGSDVGGLDELVLDGRTGVLVPPEDPAALAAAVTDLLHDPVRGAALGAAARAHVERNHSLGDQVDAHLAMYRRALTPAPKAGVVSVVIPAWNAEAYIEEAIRSALDQRTDHEVEVVVADDSSTDGTYRVAKAVDDPRVTVVRQCKGGAGGGRNTGLAFSTGEYFATLDADDRWPPDRTDQLLRALAAHPGVEAVFGRAVEFGQAEGVRTRTDPVEARIHTTGIIRRTAIDRIGGFQMRMNAENVEWMVRFLAEDPPLATIADVVLERRIHGANTGRGAAAQRRRLEAIKRGLDQRRAAQAGAPPDPPAAP